MVKAALYRSPASDVLATYGSSIAGTAVAAGTDHYFWDTRNFGWFKDRLELPAHQPTSLCILDGDAYNDRYVLLGCYDGFIRHFSSAVGTDDGWGFPAWVAFGPMMEDSGTVPIVTKLLYSTADLNSSVITFEVLAGDEPEAALNSADAVFNGDARWIIAGRSETVPIAHTGSFVYFKVGTRTAITPWAIEEIVLEYTVKTTTRGRHA